MKSLRRARMVLLLLVGVHFITPPRPAHAMSQGTETVLTLGLYGLAGGTLLGAIAWPFSGDIRTLFMGTSIGLYLGLVVGLYHLDHADDPGNPLSPNYRQTGDYGFLGEVRAQPLHWGRDPQVVARLESTSGDALTQAIRADRPLWRMDLPIYRF